MREVVKKDVNKVFDAAIIYPVPHSEMGVTGILCTEERRFNRGEE
jgi:hypothetical protein